MTNQYPDTGRVILVGAGCGPSDLITLRGLQTLQTADAVVYDALADPDLLENVRPDALCIDVGKRSGRHSVPQDEINALLVRLAGERKTVCRLKGGDPFVFGRGGEEARALRAAGIPVEEVPGVTSAVAVPAAAGIPVTHRGISRSFHVITAHTANTPDGLPEQLEILAKVEGTLVFLMGLKNLPALAARLRAAGMPGDTPAAVCGARTVRGTLADIAARAAGLPPPAVIAIGGSAGMDLWAGQGPLAGAQVGLTGTAAFRSRARCAFAALGAEPVDVQRSRISPLCTPQQLADALNAGPEWIAFTSPNGVDVFFRLLRQARIDLRTLAAAKFAAVGPRTAERLAEQGVYADLVPDHHDTAALGRALAEACTGCHVLLASAEQCSPAPYQALKAAGIGVRQLALYRTVTDAPQTTEMDYLVFGSAGGARAYFAAGGSAPRRAAACVGASTAAGAQGNCRVLVAGDTSPAALAEAAAADWLAAQPHGTLDITGRVCP